MFEHKKIDRLNDYFSYLSSRPRNTVYVTRINGFSGEVEGFITKYYDEARKTGVVIEGKLPNPDERNLSYYGEIMGMEFQMNVGFFEASLRKWLPRMNSFPRQNVAASIYDTLDSMRRAGKTENMLKNAYIKFMCWLYYRFERIVNRLGENCLPKLLYEGEISGYELMLVSILSHAGCDVVLLQYRGDQAYLRVDPGSEQSDAYPMDGLQPFPEDFSLKKLRESIRERADRERLYGTMPELSNCTNAWAEGRGLDDFRRSVGARGSDPGIFYNCYCRISGVEDKLTYENELYRFQQELRSAGRRLVIVDGPLAKPSPEEIAGIRRGSYARPDQMILDLSSNLRYPASVQLQRIMNKAFVDVMLAETANLNKLTVRAVYLLCWLRRYQGQLFSSWKAPEIGCFIYLGGCQDENEAAFMRFLARMPVDVLILCPDLSRTCCLADPLLYELHYAESLRVERYPRDGSQVRIGTVAYHAERELDTLMYQDSGMYRNQQYARANTVNLQTMYEEIPILWDQELKYRPSFGTEDGVVTLPVIFAKISGVKDGAVAEYWQSVRALITEETFFIREAPFIAPAAANPMKASATEFFRNGKLQRRRIRDHRNYPYGFLREEMQDYILDKLQLLIDQRLIRGTFENGTEYTIVSTVLNLPREIVRMLQSFDFTKKNPKLVYVVTTEVMISLEDAILTAFLNQIGFDILFFVPTGYQNVEQHYHERIMEEHQIGEYLYDLRVPELSRLPARGSRSKWLDKLFKRGN